MFKLIAFLFLVVNGATSEQPSMAVGSANTFATEAECDGYMKTAPGKEAKKSLDKALASTKQKIKVKFRCVEMKPEEDNTI